MSSAPGENWVRPTGSQIACPVEELWSVCLTGEKERLTKWQGKGLWCHKCTGKSPATRYTLWFHWLTHLQPEKRNKTVTSPGVVHGQSKNLHAFSASSHTIRDPCFTTTRSFPTWHWWEKICWNHCHYDLLKNCTTTALNGSTRIFQEQNSLQLRRTSIT